MTELLSRVASPADAFATLEGYVSAGANASSDGYRTGGGNLAAGGVPGFGHRVYRDRDPRADQLLGRLEAVATVAGTVERTRSVLEAAASLGVPAPNVDFALAALLAAMDLPPTAVAPPGAGRGRGAGPVGPAPRLTRLRSAIACPPHAV